MYIVLAAVAADKGGVFSRRGVFFILRFAFSLQVRDDVVGYLLLFFQGFIAIVRLRYDAAEVF